MPELTAEAPLAHAPAAERRDYFNDPPFNWDPKSMVVSLAPSCAPVRDATDVFALDVPRVDTAAEVTSHADSLPAVELLDTDAVVASGDDLWMAHPPVPSASLQLRWWPTTFPLLSQTVERCTS